MYTVTKLNTGQSSGGALPQPVKTGQPRSGGGVDDDDADTIAVVPIRVSLP